MDFKSDSFMYGLGICIVLFVIAQSVFFLVRAVRRAKALGIETSTVKKTISSSAVAKALGIVLPWIRLSVIGAIQYEVPAAEAAVEAFGISSGISQEITDPKIFATAAWVMTIGSVMPLVLVPFVLKKIQKGMNKVASKDSRWSDLMSAAAFIGLISAFIGRALAGSGDKFVVGDGAGVMSVAALLSSMLFMFILEKLSDKHNINWLKPFAMPFSMILAMILVMILAKVLPSGIATFEWRG